ncbi:hypothetical protein ASPSYDRAFT_160195 [Aspergillus sydowii CBS 593.65]|uniref:Uncharacterized protein n=1 Tax=Aspergillus sydowii CBS 593.65 TaxID=1036612 RepID=A0A1L9T5X9_9EURO|nr:uncharacterized protein ASPSYDRAFT_160195 [Aspergillus sydowii CBS 593.65]OJJ54836.1 hypothetical protein ASPSYDRAFT_160195 [Aspergillus sydowii CBS 593.65]
MSSLSKSRWAPASSESQKPPDRRGLLSASEELSRFMKIVARLKWKLPFLAEGYRLATTHDPAIDIAHAEIMFKLDFHEYYALLERALVHLLGVFGLTVSAASRYQGWAGSHSYHANVLDALEAETSPLRDILGSGERFSQLKRAKELRNRWKTADLSQEEKERDDLRSAMRGDRVMPLDSYDLDKIIAEIFDGLEDGYRLAETHAAQYDTLGNGRGSSAMDWDFIVDAMDWEAV